MKSHFKNLLDTVPDLRDRYVLDLGSGRGKFLVELAKNNVKSVGLELSRDYIDQSFLLAKENEVSISVDEGVGESLPYPDNTFDFVNMAEVLEHVNAPDKVLSEVFRVLKKGGLVYLSVPNRFSIKDQHYNLYFINWMPRFFAEKILSFLKKNKTYKDDIGFQELSEMHYMTYRQVSNLVRGLGFESQDIREIKINNKFKGLLFYPFFTVYLLVRPWYFDSFHLLLRK